MAAGAVGYFLTYKKLFLGYIAAVVVIYGLFYTAMRGA
jgi:hypothetical protein